MSRSCLVPHRVPLPPPEVGLIRAYLARVYPTARVSAISDERVLRLFFHREWFYALSDDDLPAALLKQLSLIQPSRYTCDDGFFGAGLLQRDASSRFPSILPCIPGSDCVRRQNAHLPACMGDMASHGNDVWLEVWHLAFDGRTRPRHKPRGWADFLDHGQAGWWYILAPGSGIFYHAGRTLAAPSKAAMLATLLEEWAQSGMQESDSSGHKGVRGGGKGGGRRLSGSHHFSGGQQKAAREMIGKFTMNDPLAFAQVFRKLERGVPCKNVSWGRWRCVGDFIPSDSFDPLLLTLGRALRYDSLMLTALMWGRVLGSQQRLIAIAQGRTPPVEPPPTPITDGELTAEIVDLRMVCTEAVRTLLLPCRLRPKCHTAQQSVRSRPRVRSRRTGTGTLWSFLTISHRARARPVSALLPTGRQTSSPPRRRG